MRVAGIWLEWMYLVETSSAGATMLLPLANEA